MAFTLRLEQRHLDRLENIKTGFKASTNQTTIEMMIDQFPELQRRLQEKITELNKFSEAYMEMYQLLMSMHENNEKLAAFHQQNTNGKKKTLPSRVNRF